MLGTPHRRSGVSSREKIMPRAKTAAQWTELTLEERRERRRLRREKQREDNVKRAAKMHAARLKSETDSREALRRNTSSRFLSDAPAGVTGNGGIHSMRACRRTTGSSIT